MQKSEQGVVGGLHLVCEELHWRSGGALLPSWSVSPGRRDFSRGLFEEQDPLSPNSLPTGSTDMLPDFSIVGEALRNDRKVC